MKSLVINSIEIIIFVLFSQSNPFFYPKKLLIGNPKPEAIPIFIATAQAHWARHIRF